MSRAIITPQLMRIAFAVALGVATTIGVAWAIAATLVNPSVAYVFGSAAFGADDTVCLHRWSTTGAVFIETHLQSASNDGWSPLRANATAVVSLSEARPGWLPDAALPWIERDTEASKLKSCYIGTDAMGWPCVALCCVQRSGKQDMVSVRESTFCIPLDYLNIRRVGSRQRFPAGLPFRPVWPGILLDTLLFAAVWWGVLMIAHMGVRRLRSQRGLCAHCTYDLRATPGGSPCPECGEPKVR